MTITTYRIDCGFSSFLLRADFSQASSPIAVDFGLDFDEDDTWSSTPFQVADASHDVEKAVRLVLKDDTSWYVDPSDDRDEEVQLKALMERVKISAIENESEATDEAVALADAVAGREGWDTTAETSVEDSRIWRTDGSAGIASRDDGRWVVLDAEGEPLATFDDLDEAVRHAEG